MSRLTVIDSIRGFSFIPMFIFHLYAMYDLTNGFRTSTTSHPTIHFLGLIRNVFILLAGISLALSSHYKKGITYYTSRLKRSFQILIHAMVITVISHYLFPGFGIKFGILHFIGVATLLLSPFASNNILLIVLLLLTIFVNVPRINPTIDTITGASINYNMADWFPLKQNLPIIITGTIIGNVLYTYKNNKNEEKKISILEWMGKNSLDLYTGHFVLLMIVFYIAKKYFHLF
jgi:uncharacterized membrane protein